MRPSGRGSTTPKHARFDQGAAGTAGLLDNRTLNVSTNRGMRYMNDKENLLYDTTKEYIEMYRTTVYKYPINLEKLKQKDINKKLKLSFSEDSLQRSVRRSRTAINDYVKCNQFDIFITFTFNPKKVDRYDLLGTYLKMQGWLGRQHRKYPDFRYIIVPEQHKDGAIHFHALISGFGGSLTKTRVIQNNKRVYNVNSFTFGFTNAQYLDDDKQKATAYLCKYITKDMQLLSNRRRYWCSKNLIKPVVYHNRRYDLGLNKFLTHNNIITENEYNVVYEFPKPSFD